MGGYSEEETPYAGPIINETIRVGDHLTFGYCDYENHSVVSLTNKEVSKVDTGERGTGHHGSVTVMVKKYPYPIPDTTKFQRVKYINESGTLVGVPDGEEALGFVDDFEALITGEQRGG